jgi:hypothetical protein
MSASTLTTEAPMAAVTKIYQEAMANKEQSIVIVFALFTVCLLAYIIYYDVTKSNQQQSDCQAMNDAYTTINPSITSIDSTFSLPLLNYYVYGAYNACSGGEYKSGFVDLCNLKAVIRQGVRFLDFEVYNENGEPVVATSTDKSTYVKETFNSIPFGQVIKTIQQYAFADTAPNKGDPVIIHLRIKTNQRSVCDKMAAVFKAYNQYMLSPDTSNNNNNLNFSQFPVGKACGKMILFVDSSNNTYQDSELNEYVNMTTNSPNCWLLTNYGVVNNPDIDDLTENNMYNMTVVVPDSGSNPTNPNFSLATQEYGCQIVAMRFQQKDGYLSDANKFFASAGRAFVLKPENLRQKPITIAPPTPANPNYSYDTRTVTTNLYSIKI